MRLLTWNIQWGRGMDGRVDLARIAAEIRAMGDFDVICLQEVAVNFPGLPGSAGEDQIALLSGALPGHAPIFAPATDVPDGRGGRKLFGNALFTRLHVGQIYRHLLPWPSDPGVPSMQRVLLEAVLMTGIGPVRVLTTHLEYYSRRQRLAQIDAIRAMHAEARDHARLPRLGKGEGGGPFEVFERPESAILCGDMNFPAGSEEHACMLAPINGAFSWRDAWQVLHPDMTHAPTVGIHKVDFVDRPACFDFIFITDDLAPRLRALRVNPETEASDHQPVWIELS